MKKHIAVIDCATKICANHCYDRLAQYFSIQFSYHCPPKSDLTSLTHLKQIDGFIVLGSASHVSENLPWQLSLGSFIKEQIQENIPTIGICFGHQLIAQNFGCEVTDNQSKSFQDGHRQCQILNNKFGFTINDQLNLIISHQQEVSKINHQFIHLGTSAQCKYDIIAMKKHPYLGLQSHPEASNYFIQSEIKSQVSKEKVEKCQNDGLKVFNNFFRSNGLL